MTIPEIIESANGAKGFSIEVLPPMKGRGIAGLFDNIDSLMEMKPRYINITTHRSELVYRSTSDGLYQKVSVRSRPGTVAVAAAIQQRYDIPAVPHLLCSGYTRLETEYALIDLNFLGINNLLILRGDKARHENRFIPSEGGHAHASDLQRQVNEFNQGLFIDGSTMDNDDRRIKFDYGVAGYPEKHDEAPNSDIDLQWLKYKVDMGASYIVTQMFFDNEKYFSFVERCRQAGINVPIIPGIKPIVNRNQLTVLPKVFHVDLPSELANELTQCKDDAAAKQVGVEWLIHQLKDLYSKGVDSVHIYSLNAFPSVYKALSEVL
ncbi:MAG: methylenetetrahydrofolate reductase [Paramuribaculum sp.]|nr:methylenetetrahydrofolate reductase [Paramuribaculum sp.]MDE6304102.1 methylenetetrahydrofolate reductase [Paramuribaculum sp.]